MKLTSSNSSAVDILLAIPLGAFVGAVVLLVASAVGSPVTLTDVLEMPIAAGQISLFLLPFAGVAALLAYFPLRAIGHLGIVQCGLVGAAVAFPMLLDNSLEPGAIGVFVATGFAAGAGAGLALVVVAKRRERRQIGAAHGV
jgi:hypothetical protein